MQAHRVERKWLGLGAAVTIEHEDVEIAQRAGREVDGDGAVFKLADGAQVEVNAASGARRADPRDLSELLTAATRLVR